MACQALAELPCPSVALIGEAALTAAERFDVHAASETDLEPIVSAVRRTPMAAMALVQLLRHSAGLEAHAGLLVESLVYSTLQSGPEFGAWLDGRPEKPSIRPPLAPAVRVSRRDDLLEVVLDRPDKHNAFSSLMRDEFTEALRVALGDPSIRRVVVTGAGASFCSGGDLDEFGTLPDPATAHAIRSTRNPARLVAACADRLRFEVHGACVGAGVELPAFAHHVVATRDAYFQLPEVSMGLVPGAGGTVSIPRRIGRQRTAYMALSGQRVDVETARRWGLVDEVVR